jgi:Na+/H+ antiporter NhaD/arsenite permease-like protein
LIIALVVIFIAIYAAVALEHPLEINKSAFALFGAGLLWAIYALSIGWRCRLHRAIQDDALIGFGRSRASHLAH